MIARQVGAVVAEAAVAVARTAMVAKREPIEIEIAAAGDADPGGDRAIDRVAGRNRTVGAGVVVMHVAGDVGVLRRPMIGCHCDTRHRQRRRRQPSIK